ncbi:hypothetical protein GVX76_04775 [[Haemophilus] felis]|nr:hypothetical protein [[Haemophilus] felis]
MKKIKFSFIALSISVLVACSTGLMPVISGVPKELHYQQRTYQLQAQQDLGTIARFVYLTENDQLNNWQSALELLLDPNVLTQSLEQRLALRKRVYQNTGVRNANLYLENNSLWGVIIYPPTEKHQDWQIDVLQGRNVQNCGFMQYQFSRKFPASENLAQLTDSIAPQELARLKNNHWKWNCE